MPTANAYFAEASRDWRSKQIEIARSALEAKNFDLASKALRAAVCLSFRRRQAIRQLRAGHTYEICEDDRELEEFDKHLESHKLRFQRIT